MRLKKILSELPPYCKKFFDSKRNSMEARSERGYAEDLLIFFKYLTTTFPEYMDYNTKDVPVSVFDELSASDIDDFLEYVEEYSNNGIVRKNGENGKSRKLASIKTLCRYLEKYDYIRHNPAQLVDSIKKHENDIYVLTPRDIDRMYDEIDNGTGMGSKQLKFHEQNILRDKAILTILLCTGIRVSELVGLDLQDVDLENMRLRVTRKGGDRQYVYFKSNVHKALTDYLGTYSLEVVKGQRDSFNIDSHETALFVSQRKRNRLSVRSVQYMIKTYANLCMGKGNRITPHKFRSTYGTMLYEREHDPQLVANALGHKSIVTAQKHYVKLSEQRRKDAAMDYFD